MKSVEGVLREELERLKEAERSYEEQIRKLPKGSIQQKKIKGHLYPYLALRKSGKVVYQYLGRMPEKDLSALRKGLEQRRRYERMLKEVQQNIVRVEKMIRGRGRSV